MANTSKDKVGLAVLVDKDISKQARKILIDEGISMAKWINDLLAELILKHEQLHVQQTSAPQTTYLKHDLMDK